MKKLFLTICLAGMANLHASTIAFSASTQTGPGIGDSVPVAVAAGFVPGQNYTLTDVQVSLSYIVGSGVGMTIEILDDSGADSPGNDVLESWTTGTLPAFTGSVPAPQVLDDTKSLELDGGSQYWLAFFDDSPQNTEDVLYAHSGGGYFHNENGNGPWVPNGGQTLGFEIDGTALASPTPEPSTLSLAVLAMSFVAGSVWLRKQIQAMH